MEKRARKRCRRDGSGEKDLAWSGQDVQGGGGHGLVGSLGSLGPLALVPVVSWSLGEGVGSWQLVVGCPARVAPCY